MKSKKLRILFLNQYFPPDPAPTGILLKEVADELKGFAECDLIAADQSYRKKSSGHRAIRELQALWTILLKGLRAQKADLVVSGSSPPCMAVVAALIARFHRAKSLHWAMDIYPELAVALGEIKPGLLLQVIRKAMRWAYRNTEAVIALDEDMARKLEPYGAPLQILRPWLPEHSNLEGGAPAAPGEEPPKNAHPPTPSVSHSAALGHTEGPVDNIWIYSGNLGRAHEWETLLEAQALLEKRGSPLRLVFQGNGASWGQAREKATQMGLRQCEWHPYVAGNQLLATLLNARAIIVTQRNETQGLLWPSKLALAMDLPRPILWVGPKGAISSLLSRSESSGKFESGNAEGIANWLEALPKRAVEKLCDASSHRQESLAVWRELILKIAAR